jgi:hypothetical protein
MQVVKVAAVVELAMKITVFKDVTPYNLVGV